MHQHKTIIPGKNENDGDPMQMAGKVEELREIISRSKRIVFFGGAGVSTASGIPDFRSETGLFAQEENGLSPEMILSKSFFYLQPEKFFDFWRKHMLHPEAGPNAATFRKILEFFPDAGLYIIDAHDRIVAFNHRNCEANNIVSEMDYIGRTCKDIYPKEFAEQYMALVRQVRETGVAVENQVYTHAVYPLRDAHDAIIGTATVWRPVASGDTLPDWYGCLKRVVTFIDKNYARPITLQTLAAEAGMSVTHFLRLLRPEPLHPHVQAPPPPDARPVPPRPLLGVKDYLSRWRAMTSS